MTNIFFQVPQHYCGAKAPSQAPDWKSSFDQILTIKGDQILELDTNPWLLFPIENTLAEM